MLSRGDFREYVVGTQEGGIPAYAGMTGQGAGYDGRGCGNGGEEWE